MAEGYLRYFCNDKSEVYSAGIEAHGLNPKAVQVMLEDGIDISHHTSNQIDDYKHTGFDYVITVCDNAKENCPYFPSTAKKYHYNFPDPAKASGTEEEILQQFRAVRDTIKDYCKKFAVDHLA
jgi:arsenate reductase